MRLTKTLYIIEEIEGEIIGYDELGRPIFGTIETETPFKCEIEPYSNQLANFTYGVSVEVSHRVFCYPHEKIELNTKIKRKYDDPGKEDEHYKVTENMKYDRHFEVLITKGVV